MLALPLFIRSKDLLSASGRIIDLQSIRTTQYFLDIGNITHLSLYIGLDTYHLVSLVFHALTLLINKVTNLLGISIAVIQLNLCVLTILLFQSAVRRRTYIDKRHSTFLLQFLQLDAEGFVNLTFRVTSRMVVTIMMKNRNEKIKSGRDEVFISGISRFVFFITCLLHSF